MPTDISAMRELTPNDPATQMLAAGLERIRADQGKTQRDVAQQLGYTSSVALSHMAVGRAPIPVDRALDIANVLGLDPKRFLLAVLEQRFPSSNIRELFGVQIVSRDGLATRLSLLAGHDLDDLPTDIATLLEEVVTAAQPRRRWLTIEELALIELLRRKFPALKKRALNDEQVASLDRCLSSILAIETEGGR